MLVVELDVQSNFSFLSAASHPEELAERAAKLGYTHLGVADRNSLAGVVRAHVAAKKAGVRLLVGARIRLRENLEELFPQELPLTLLLYPHSRAGYARLSSLLTKGKLRAPKGECFLTLEDVLEYSQEMDCLVDFDEVRDQRLPSLLLSLREAFPGRLSLLLQRLYLAGEGKKQKGVIEFSQKYSLPLVAGNGVTYHSPRRRALQDVLTCIREGCTLSEAGYLLQENAERYLKSPQEMKRLYRKFPQAILRAKEIAERASGFSLDELKYQYPHEVCPEGKSPTEYLREIVFRHIPDRYPQGLSPDLARLIEHELNLIRELEYERYFLTVYDIVQFAKARKILCQGRGAAANSAVCYILGITVVDPTQVRLLMERFISKERNEPPDIDIDFEHERREEIIQYLYEKYGRHRAALVAEVVCYRTRSAFRDIGKVFGLSLEEIEGIIKTFTRFRDRTVTKALLEEMGLDLKKRAVRATIALSQVLKSFPRHLSQHVGGFVLSDIPLSEIVPIENAAMENRTVLEWDKDDIDAMGMLKIDVLALGMLTAIRKSLEFINSPPQGTEKKLELYSIPKEDPAVYDMICKADTLGVFQIESRAQMSMLPRLRPRCFYDLVVEVAIVRPGPIQGGMVHPYLRRRMNKEKVTFPDERIRSVLAPTLGVPIFQEQVMELSVVAAGFTPGEADELRRAMASWKKNKNLITKFRDKIYQGMRSRGYSQEFAERLFDQIQGFGEYGFPQSHSASFATLVYASSWIKHYYPECFAAALINSQPMGFYQPAQILQDAKHHGVEILPIDINHSDWDCSVQGKKVRLGMRLVRGVSEREAQRIVSGRVSGAYRNVNDLWRRSKAKVSQLKLLAKADSFRSFGYDRQRAVWEVGKLRDEYLPLFEGLSPREESISLPRIKERYQVWRDYSAFGLSLRKHPIAFARSSLKERQIVTIAEFKERSKSHPNSWLSIAGLVLMRQRPATANGVIFMTLEDETGMANLIIRRGVQEKYQNAILDGVFVIARGRTQQEAGVIHLLLEEMYAFNQGSGEIDASSRDFR